MTWKPIDLSARLFTNVDEAVLRKASAAIENAFINEAGGQSRFPGLADFATLAGNSPVYLWDWQEDLIAVTNSRWYRVSSAGVVTDVTGVPLTGGRRPVFDKTPSELVAAAGGPIIRLRDATTEKLSDEAPDTTHVQYIDGYLTAIETDTGLFAHSEVDDGESWDPLDTFAANGKPDNLVGMLITPHRELMLAGPDSLEQFERLPQGSLPFFRRWALAKGVKAPYTMIAEDGGLWFVNKGYEFVKVVGQSEQQNAVDIGKSLEGIDDWTDAWADSMRVAGQKFIILQIPHASNGYGTKGVTFLYDFKKKKWSQLYGWDQASATPIKWPGWSYRPMWGRHFVGGNGKVLELREDTFTNDGQMQRFLGRTGHIDAWGDSTVNNLRMRMKRGTVAQAGADDPPPYIELRVKRDGMEWSPWKKKSMGAAGDKSFFLEFGPQGTAMSWQWEWRVTANVDVQLVALWADVENASR